MNSPVDSDKMPVTVIVSRVVKIGSEQAYEEWIKGISREAMKFEGHCGVSLIRPSDRTYPEYVLIFKFDSYGNLRKWNESAVRQEWLDRAQPLVEGDASVQVITGMETWFTLPEKPLRRPPPRYKMLIITWVTVYVLLNAVGFVLTPVVAWLPPLVRTLVLSFTMVTLMTYFAMPAMTKLFYKWLYPKP